MGYAAHVTTERIERTNEQWLAELQSDGAAADSAQRALHALVIGAVRKATSTQGQLDEATIDDLTQVAVLRIVQNLERFEGRSKFTTWAFSVAVRAAFSELRKSMYHDGAEELSQENAGALASQDVEPAAFAERSEIVEVMHRVIAEELTERQRAAILGDLGGTSQDDIALQLGVNRNALYKLVHDARLKLVKGLRGAGICDDQVRVAFDL